LIPNSTIGSLCYNCRYCEDHCPHDAVIKGECERYQDLGQRHPKQACFIECDKECVANFAKEKAGTLWKDGGNGPQDRGGIELAEVMEMWIEKTETKHGPSYKNVREYVPPPTAKKGRLTKSSGKAPALTPSARAAKQGNHFHGSGGIFKQKIGYFPTAHMAACAVGLYDYARSKLGLDLALPISPSMLVLCLTFAKQEAPTRLKPYTVAARKDAALRCNAQEARWKAEQRHEKMGAWIAAAAAATGVAPAGTPAELVPAALAANPASEPGTV
jgi:hypothetical protein